MYASKQLGIAVLSMLAVIIVGTFGFMWLEEIDLFHSLWMTVITVLTVGYGDAIPITRGGRIFALLIIPMGIGIATYAIGAVTALIIEGNIFQAVGRRRMEKQIARLQDHIIVCGYGRVGAQVVQELQQKDIPLVVIDKELSLLEGEGIPFIEGDATEDEVLQRAGITRAAGLVAALPQDAQNVFITLTARGMQPDIQIVARAERTNSEEKLRRAGADKVINPASIAGRRIAMDIVKPLSVSYVDTILYDNEDVFGIEEIQLSEGAALIGKTLRENDLRGRFHVTVLAILRGGQVRHNPAGEEMLHERDMIIVFGPMEQLRQLEKACQMTE
ncbi:potassium channel family protein [Ectobacillus ponti]|uniref:Potassium channel protein n=1 Tax=Ectobacillus ponti TaxID=2961894 RepID=A0AA41X7E9_9BACI|nr:potassium channel protein [Ectobacillus ponti]MCP8968014.1 potassium channel protein [Ectobacillus ponti]